VRRVFPIVAGLLILLLADSGVAGAAELSSRVAAHGRGYVTEGKRLLLLARRGDARAQTLLGFAYAAGRGVPQYLPAAVKWYRRAAEQGNPTAQYLLGLMYDKGQGVAPDKVIAHKWLILAAARAVSREREYYARIRDAVASTMSRDEIAEAQYLAYRWAARNIR
jgi:TPR repeat protein